MSKPPYDPRAVANLILDMADQDGLPITNLVLQKLLYFAHGHFLIQSGIPLVRGGFEVWTHGPVHPAAYQAFKSSGKSPIRFRAEARNFATGQALPLHTPDDLQVRRHIRSVLAAYGHLPAGRLVDISHAPRAPWAETKNKAETSIALGLRISDNVIMECFKHHKVSVGPESRAGEPDEETPLAGH